MGTGKSENFIGKKPKFRGCISKTVCLSLDFTSCITTILLSFIHAKHLFGEIWLREHAIMAQPSHWQSWGWRPASHQRRGDRRPSRWRLHRRRLVHHVRDATWTNAVQCEINTPNIFKTSRLFFYIHRYKFNFLMKFNSIVCWSLYTFSRCKNHQKL